jgi:DNA-binding MarR family transcriptional regulator/N-acetylglutamate synthase-like GNAT family acetyltransferase
MTDLTPAAIAAVRRFNRLYTRELGLLGARHLDSPFGLTEIRILFELAHREGPTAAELATDLGLDRGQLSRLLAKFEREGLVRRMRHPDDGRRAPLALTAKGRRVFADLDTRAEANVGSVLGHLPPSTRNALIQAATALGDPGPAPAEEVILRDPRPGDFGWVIHRHGVLYAAERGWPEAFEGFVAEVIGRFAQKHDPAKERFWIAERAGAIVGTVFVVENAPGVAQLRCLLVEPGARGLGLGQRLVRACVEFAREAGYQRMILWTHDVLTSARRLYEAEGFRLVAQETHATFGKEEVGETWELVLR